MLVAVEVCTLAFRLDELTKANIVAVAAVSMTAEEKSELADPKPAAAHARWIRPLACYERRETTIVEGLRYG